MGTVNRWFKCSKNRSHLSLRPTANMSSTCTTAMVETDAASINRKTHSSARLCSKPRLFRRINRWLCQDRDTCFKQYITPIQAYYVFSRTVLRSPETSASEPLPQFGLDRSLLYIEMAQIQLHLACYRSHQADAWHGGGGGKSLMVTNSRALAKTSCYRSRFRFHYLTILV